MLILQGDLYSKPFSFVGELEADRAVGPLGRVGGKRGNAFTQPFSHRPSPNRAGNFHCTRLSGIAVILADLWALTSLSVSSVHVIGSPYSTAS